MQKHYSHVIFDFNDVISPSNFVATACRFESVLGMSGQDFVNLYIDAGLLDRLLIGEFKRDTDFWRAVSGFTGVDYSVLLAIGREVAHTKQVDVEVVEIIRELKAQHYTLSLLTDNLQETFDYWMRKFELETLFDRIFNSADLGLLKSNTLLYEEVLEQLKVDASKVIMVDDCVGNLKVAASVGIDGVLFTNVVDLRESLAKVGVIVGNV